MPLPIVRVKPTGWNTHNKFRPDHATNIDAHLAELAAIVGEQAMQTWQGFGVQFEGPTTGIHGYDTVANSDVGKIVCGYSPQLYAPQEFRPKKTEIAVFGTLHSQAPSPGIRYFVSANGMHWRTNGTLGAFVPSDANGDSDDLVVVSLTSPDVMQSHDHCMTWNVLPNVAPAGFGFRALHFLKRTDDLPDGRLLASLSGLATNTAQRVYTSDDLGTLWTPRTVGAYVAMSDFADNGEGIVLGFGVHTAGGDPAFEIWRSEDYGATWELARTVATFGNVCYSDRWDQFVVTLTDGTILTSQTGETWLTRASAMTTANGRVSGDHVLASVAGCIAQLFHATIPYASNGDRRPGVMYSWDLGASWRFVDFGYSANIANPTTGATKFPTMLRAWSGRFLAGSPGAVYYSGVLEIGDADLVAT